MKRSAQVALVVMAATGVGAGAYSLMPRQDCPPSQPGALQPDSCRGSGRGGTYAHSSWRSSSSPSSAAVTSPRAAASLSRQSGSGPLPTGRSGGTTRGGFGGFASLLSGGG